MKRLAAFVTPRTYEPNALAHSPLHALHPAAAWITDMKNLRIALLVFAAIGSLAGSAQLSPAAAGSLGLDWLSNDNYVRCLKYMKSLAHGDAAAYDRGRRACNRQYFPGPGHDH